MNSISALKAYGLNPLQGMSTTQELLTSWINSKEFSREAIITLSKSRVMGFLVWDLLRNSTADIEGQAVINYFLRNPHANPGIMPSYTGSRLDNSEIDSALSQSKEVRNYKFGSMGSVPTLNFNHASLRSTLPANVRQVKIAIIGQGAAGILVAYVLRLLGFSPTTFEKGDLRGIWSRKNVYEGSKNNPVTLNMLGTTVGAAPGNGVDIAQFLSNFYRSAVAEKAVDKIIPGNKFDHKLVYGKSEISYPIVINCCGVGSPKSLSDISRMTTSVNTTGSGERWQRKLTKEEARRKLFTFVGLGNSTAEMLRQLHTFQDDGVDCDYTILTHYPIDAINTPDSDVRPAKRNYRVFRDLSKPNLTSYQGDLPESRYDYFRALHTGRIRAGIKNWGREAGGYVTYKQGSGYPLSFKTDSFFTLIGYQTKKADFEKFGIPTHTDNCALLDYDGEVQREDNKYDGISRLYKGYYVFGAMAANPTNENAIVIPGMLFRLYDLIPSIILRAAESVL